MATKLDKLVTYGEVKALKKSSMIKTTWHMRSCDKLKTKHFFIQKIYGHQTLLGTCVWWGQAQNEAQNLMVTWSQACDHVTIKLSRVVTNGNRKLAME